MDMRKPCVEIRYASRNHRLSFGNWVSGSAHTERVQSQCRELSADLRFVPDPEHPVSMYLLRCVRLRPPPISLKTRLKIAIIQYFEMIRLSRMKTPSKEAHV
ncbi:hypothetical protein SAMN05421543_1514 [Alicyclobacillus macrosporangiidus]|uniref:Uncharacterized protein n=1 Tax=Alicyclobacillus macrosporangiidus TaxID=392015 RepID=A0A1I7LHD3_9BACL|nr:hypothetical protein SAMN05421543_1514 [Alicyclobacillus macrosporangiidus]